MTTVFTLGPSSAKLLDKGDVEMWIFTSFVVRTWFVKLSQKPKYITFIGYTFEAPSRIFLPITLLGTALFAAASPGSRLYSAGSLAITDDKGMVRPLFKPSKFHLASPAQFSFAIYYYEIKSILCNSSLPHCHKSHRSCILLSKFQLFVQNDSTVATFVLFPLCHSFSLQSDVS